MTPLGLGASSRRYRQFPPLHCCYNSPAMLRQRKLHSVVADSVGVAKSAAAGATEDVKRIKVKKGTLKRLMAAVKPESGKIVTAMIALLFSSGTNMAFPTIMGKVIDRTAGKSAGTLSSIPDQVCVRFCKQPNHA
jgi:hypothetical protein